MRTTVNLDDDVAAAVEELRRRDGAGFSEVLNRLVRVALTRRDPRPAYHHRSFDLGLTVDVRNVGEALDLLDGR